METTLTKTKKQFVIDLYDAFKRGDIQFIIDHLSDDIEWRVPGAPGVPYGGTYTGKEGVLNFFQTLSESVEITSFEYKDFIESGDWVIARGSYGVRSAGSEKEPVEMSWVMCWKFKDGLPVFFDDYFDTYKVYESLN